MPIIDKGNAMMKRTLTAALTTVAVIMASLPAFAEGELNLYSSRHYDTDERLYSDFEAETGITINRIEAGASELIERMKAEGANSPADVLITVDAGRMWRADQAGLLQPVQSDVLGTRIPANLRHPDGHWFGFSQRARMIFYNKNEVSDPPRTYEELASPKYKGMICARSSGNIYMQSLLAALIEHYGEDVAENWAKGFYANFARKPQGGDTDQLRGIVSGECMISLANSYYFARALRRDVNDLSDSVDMIGWIFPNQADQGTHVNLSVAGVAAHAPNRENAVKFLEYLASDSAQQYFSAGNDEYPAVPGVGLSASVATLGLFHQDRLELTKLGENQVAAQQIYDRIGYE